MRLSDELRQAVINSELSQYRIALETGIHKGQISRFVRGQAWLGAEAIDVLGELLGLHITVKR